VPIRLESLAEAHPGDEGVDLGIRCLRRGRRAAGPVVQCRYAETYKAMGLGEIGHLPSCNRDGAFCEGYDPRLKLERTQTIMQGASYCDFKYSYK
jgi:hypothetical protein